MPAPDTQALSVVREREQAARDEAALKLRQAEDHHAQARAQADSLAQYRAEYIARWNNEFKGAKGIQLLQCYQSFMQRLDEAITQQREIVRRTETAVAQRRDELVAAETRMAAVGKLIGRRVEEHRLKVQRRDQRSTDEAAQRTRSARRDPTSADTTW
jgi:flagellar protein FliJ